MTTYCRQRRWPPDRCSCWSGPAHWKPSTRHSELCSYRFWYMFLFDAILFASK